jgi:dTDP-glucose 4,6-dehydratase
MKGTKVLITGGCGFIGSNFIRYLLKNDKGIRVINLDALTYAGNPENLAEYWDHPSYEFIKGDICDERLVEGVIKGGVDAIINFAAETHVDRSLYEPAAFLKTNLFGTYVLLEVAKRFNLRRFVHISTDEVYGSIDPPQRAREDSPLNPSSVYSASKAGADLIALSYYTTFGLPVLITRSSNNYGPYQFPEKLIPLFITRASQDQDLPLYGDGLNVRDWLFVEDNCEGIYRVFISGQPGRIYNIGTEKELTNLEVTHTLLDILGKPTSLINHIKDRPGHDRRYALDCTRARLELGWSAKVPFEEGLQRTIHWYRTHHEWVERVKTGEYYSHYERHYTALSK